MMNFGSRKIKKASPMLHLITIAIFVAILVIFLYAVSLMAKTNKDAQLESLTNAIDRCVVQCYALEGTYPPNLQYMKDHYGLTYDENAFFVDYQSVGSNIAPDVTIIAKN